MFWRRLSNHHRLVFTAVVFSDFSKERSLACPTSSYNVVEVLSLCERSKIWRGHKGLRQQRVDLRSRGTKEVSRLQSFTSSVM